MHVIAKGEIGFFKFIVLPLYVLLNRFFDNEIEHYVKNIN